MANEQRRPNESNDPKRNDPHRGGGQGRESERGPMNPGSGNQPGSDREFEQDRMDRERSRTGGSMDPHRGGSGSTRSDDRD